MKLNPLILAAATILAGHAHAAVIVASANFTGLSGTNLNTLAASGTPGVNEFAWSMFGASNQMSIVNANITTGSGNALQLNDSTNTGFRGILGTMSSSTTIDIGETLTLSFSGKYIASDSNNAAGLRFGFVNSGDLDNAYGISVGTNGNTGMSLSRDSGGDDSPLAGTLTPVTGGLTGPTPAYTGITTSTFAALFSITRTDASTYSLSGSMNGSTISATDVMGQGWDNYNRIFIRNGSNNRGFQVDDVSVTLIPEPSAALLGGLGLLALLRRRR